MRMMVTGCAGFIGSHLSEALLAEGHEVVGVDCLTDYYPVALKETNLHTLRDQHAFVFHQLDLAESELDALLDGVEVIYHQAAQPGVRASWGSSFDTYVRNNVLATQRLLETVKRKKIQKFVYASSSSVYGDAERFPTNEGAVPRPVSPYGTTKLAGEHLTWLYWRNYGVPTISLRYFTVYGPRQRPDMAFHRFIRWAQAGEPIQVYGDGNQTRDFTFIRDAVAANLAAGACSVSGHVMNIGGGSRVSVRHVIDTLADLMGTRVRAVYGPPQPGDVRDTCADTTLAAKLLSYAPRVDLREGLSAEVDWVERTFSAAPRDGVAPLPSRG